MPCYDINSPFHDTHCECGVDYIIVDNYLYVCPTCGICDTENALQTIPYSYFDCGSVCRYEPYKRRTYFKQLLEQVSLRKDCDTVGYMMMVYALKDCPFSNTYELKQLMKDKGYNKYYKYIFNTYRDIKGTHLIEIDPSLFEHLMKEFHQFDLWYKKKCRRRNLINYNVLLYHMLKRHGVRNYDSILLPQNHVETSEIIEEYWKVENK